LCIGAAFLSKRPLWERLLMVASAAPIAVIANVARITMTGVLFEIAGRWPAVIDLETRAETIHDWAGYAMMPIGLLVLLGEMSLLSKLMISPESERLLTTGRAAVGGGTRVAAAKPAAARAAAIPVAKPQAAVPAAEPVAKPQAAEPQAAVPAAAKPAAIPSAGSLLQRSPRRRK
jgi:exosortase/archaeosortase family protein